MPVGSPLQDMMHMKDSLLPGVVLGDPATLTRPSPLLSIHPAGHPPTGSSEAFSLLGLQGLPTLVAPLTTEPTWPPPRCPVHHTHAAGFAALCPKDSIEVHLVLPGMNSPAS